MVTDSNAHTGGNKNFWRNERVDNYDSIQALLSEKKAEEQQNIVRIIRYFDDFRQITNPAILDIGCGPGTPITIARDILEKIPECTLIGVDGSEEMVAKAITNLSPIFGGRFTGIVGDFNSDRFWADYTIQKYDFIVFSTALHYLSDQRRKPFFREVYDHLNSRGIFIAGIPCCDTNSDIGEMEQTFRFKYTYDKMKELGRATDFAEFKRSAEAIDTKAKINWQSPGIWLSAMREAGFKGAEVVWQVWVRSIFAAVK